MNSRHVEIVGLGSPFSYKFILQTKTQTIRDFKYTQSSQRLADLNQVSQSNGHNFYTKPFLLSFFFKSSAYQSLKSLNGSDWGFKSKCRRRNYWGLWMLDLVIVDKYLLLMAFGGFK